MTKQETHSFDNAAAPIRHDRKDIKRYAAQTGDFTGRDWRKSNVDPANRFDLSCHVKNAGYDPRPNIGTGRHVPDLVTPLGLLGEEA